MCRYFLEVFVNNFVIYVSFFFCFNKIIMNDKEDYVFFGGILVIIDNNLDFYKWNFIYLDVFIVKVIFIVVDCFGCFYKLIINLKVRVV